MRTAVFLASLFFAAAAFAQSYDTVLQGGRVMDPETGVDAIRNVGITQGRIMRISPETLAGKRVLDAKGLVVAPGFIDLHQHGQDVASGRVKAFDGVTTALEMEIGAPDVAAFLQKKDGRSLINYGTTASHAAARALVFGQPIHDPTIVPPSGAATNQPASLEQIKAIEDRLRQELDAGALGIGMGIQYTPGATRFEVIQMFRLAAARRVPVFTHVRSFGLLEPGSSIEAISEVIGAAAISGASLHIVHINSSCTSVGLECVSLVAGARARGLDITTEAYPYIAGMTAINSALFNPGWKEKLGVDYSALQLPDTGERLTKERFDVLHAAPGNLAILIFMNTQEMVDAVIAEPLVMIASDGEDGHPRNAGTFSRVLARYVRERGSITLMDAIRKMALMPAQRLEKSTLAARRKGRLQEGADADIVVFDPKTVADRATFAAPREPSAGMKYVIVGGSVLIDQGKLMANTFPGKPLLPDQPGK
ncbi:MAG TPA: amidohydrolase family protein [Steroidobacteraceae bacterium]|nr:amidohydrolase family protein [Steroidobacteraceae bacterium]